MSKAREDRAKRVNDVRRGTRELLSRIRHERISRGDKSGPKPPEPALREDFVPSAGLLPDPMIARLSEQLMAGGSTSAPLVPELADPDAEPMTPSQPTAAHPRAEAGSHPGRISRNYESAQLGISPINGSDARLKLDMSFARPTRSQFSKHAELAKFAGLEPLSPAPRGDDGSTADQPVASEAQSAPSGGLPGLDTIPTLGPGIVWRLSEAGVRTMADLARSDAATLRKSLGQIGRLVKVEDWIAHARAVVAGRSPVSGV